MLIPDPLPRIGLDGAVLLAGFAGGLVSLQSMKEMTRGKACTALFTSLAIAGYLTPLATRWFSATPGALQYSIAFLLGLCAMRIAPLVQNSVPALWEKYVLKSGADDNDLRGKKP